jgi:hypothetical protein
MAVLWMAAVAAASGAGMVPEGMAVDAAKREARVEFRPADGESTAAGARAEALEAGGAAKELPAEWKEWGGDDAPACAWMVVVDTSNPARAKMIAQCAKDAQALVGALPEKDAVEVCSLARNLKVVAPFGAGRAASAAALEALEPKGDAALTTLIYVNLRGGLDRLKACGQKRKALVVFSDGKDESPDAVAREAALKKLAEAARAAGIAIHAMGYAETADDQKYFAGLMELARATGGLFAAADLKTRKLPEGSVERVHEAMHGGGTVRVDLSKLDKPAPVKVTLRTDSGAEAEALVPEAEVARTIPKPKPPPPPDSGKEITPSPRTPVVDESSLRFEADAKAREVAASFRMVSEKKVEGVSVRPAGGGKELPVRWEPWPPGKEPACAWMVVVDTGDPARAATISKCVAEAGALLGGLPKRDTAAVFSLARDLVEAVPFGGGAGDLASKLGKPKPEPSLIFTNLQVGLNQLKNRKEPRKAVVLFTDGKDESPDDSAREAAKRRLIEAARSAGIAIHTVAYAETAKGQSYFAPLKEISAATGGLHIATSLRSKETPEGAMDLLRAVMHGAGTARVDVSSLEKATPLVLSVRGSSGGEATIEIPVAEVEPAVPKPLPPPPPPPPPPEEPAVPAWLAWTLGLGLLAVLGVAALMLRASRRKRAAEEARVAEELRAAEEARAEEDRRRDAARIAAAAQARSDDGKKPSGPPLAWIEMCDAEQNRIPITVSNARIGRGRHNDIVFSNDSVSGNHCVIERDRDGNWTIIDLNSGNGVLVNGKEIERAVLREGDTVELGEIKFRFLPDE